MKWREPLRSTIGAFANWQDCWRRVLRGALVWYGVFAAMVLFYWLLEKVPQEALVERLLMVVPFAICLAVLVYLAWLLSPRKISSGPRDIVISKSDEMLLIPWDAIASFRFSNSLMPGALHIMLHSGCEYTLNLSRKVDRADVRRELSEMTGAQV